MLSKEEYAKLNSRLFYLKRQLHKLERQKIEHKLECELTEFFGEIECGKDIIVDNRGQRYVVVDFDKMTEWNMTQKNAEFPTVYIQKVKKNGELADRWNVLYRFMDCVKTGETL